MIHYSVTQTIQSTVPFSTEPPVDIPFYRGDDIGKAFSALLMAGQPSSDLAYFRVLSVRMDHKVMPDPDCLGCQIQSGQTEGNTATPCTC